MKSVDKSRNANLLPRRPVLGNLTLGLGDIPYAVPSCPACGEVTYDLPECFCCGQPFIYDEEVEVESRGGGCAFV